MLTTGSLLVMVGLIVLLYIWAERNEDDDPPGSSQPVGADPLSMMHF